MSQVCIVILRFFVKRPRVRKLSVVILHNNAIVARCILDTYIALWATRSATYIVSYVGTLLTEAVAFTGQGMFALSGSSQKPRISQGFPVQGVSRSRTAPGPPRLRWVNPRSMTNPGTPCSCPDNLWSDNPMSRPDRGSTRPGLGTPNLRRPSPAQTRPGNPRPEHPKSKTDQGTHEPLAHSLVQWNEIMFQN